MPTQFLKLSCRFKPQMLIANRQIGQQILLRHQKETDLFEFRDDLRDPGQDGAYFASIPAQEIEHQGDNEAASIILAPGQTLQGTGFRLVDLRSLAQRARILMPFDDYDGPHPPLPNVSLGTEDITRYKMAWRAVGYMEGGESPAGWPVIRPLVQRCKDWPDVDNILELPIALGFTAVALIYGGLHALAWHAHFDSSTQQLLWRISACVVMGGFPVFFVLWLGHELVEDWMLGAVVLPRPEIKHGRATIYADFIIYYFLYYFLRISASSVLLAYTLARAYLVVECFINLSHLPAGVYDVPNWAPYVPHIS